MKRNRTLQKALLLFALAFVGWSPTRAAENVPTTTSPARMTVSLQVLGDNKRAPEVNASDVIVKQGKERVSVTGWTPARGDRAGLDLFILIDDASDPSLGSQLADLRGFINAQAPTTAVGVGYMRNGTVQIAQNFTTEHSKAADSVRLPLTYSGAYGSPYLSAIDLMKRWPDNGNRREILMITDGVDRARRASHFRTLSYNPDVDSASRVAQRTGTMIHTLFANGVGRLGHNYWEITNGQNGLAMLADQTGGQSYFLGMQTPVSFQPYLTDLKKTLDNQYVLEFQANASKKSGLQAVNLSTEVAGVELNSADTVWVNAN